MFLGCLPLYPVLALPARPLGWLDALAVVVTGGAIAIEALSDHQLHDWIENRKGPGEIMTEGLWGYSRHPNYFGEASFWWGLYLFGLAADPSYYWTGVGALAITAMFVLVSIPMLDQRSLERRPGYEEHMEMVSGFIPMLPPRRP